MARPNNNDDEDDGALAQDHGHILPPHVPAGE